MSRAMSGATPSGAAAPRSHSPVARHVQGPAAGVRRQERVGDLEGDTARAGVGPRLERGPHVHEPQPDPVADRQAEPLWLDDLQEQRVVDWRPPRLDPADEVDADHPFPQRAFGGGVEGVDLEHL